jgi:hypothetical protein
MDNESKERLRVAAGNVLRAPDALLVFSRILEESGYLGMSFTGDAATTFHNEGRRRMGMFVLDMLMAADETILAKLTHFAREEKNRKERFHEPDGRDE